jgi:WD40-like Beta Propeller Repeat
MRTRVPRRASICLLVLACATGVADESNAQKLSPMMLCPWSQLHQPSPELVLAAAAPGGSVNAQSQFAPYYGKNQIHYDKFEWFIYKTDHFEIYYYAENEPHLARVASYAESAYQHVSSDLRHDLAARVPLIIFKTHSEFEQQNIAPGQSPEGVLAFAEGERNRMVLPIDLPTDLLYGLIVHELTHVFQYDIIPTSLIRRNLPLWVHEGGAEYERGIWDPLDLMTVRDAAVADIIPRMSQMEGYGDFGNVRLVYNLGHALYEFIETRWGKDGVRQFLFSLRKSAIGGGTSPYEEAFQMNAREFDQQFEKYLKDRFKAFRDKERPADYGQDLSPDPEKSQYTGAISIEPSPSGDLIAVATGNRRDQELDIILVSAKDGAVVRNLTPGFDMDRGFEYIAQPSGSNMVPWVSWSPVGDRIAYFVRNEKYKTLIMQNVLTGKIERRYNIETVDNPESPNISPDGRSVLFSGLRTAVGDIFKLDVNSGDITNLTNDEFADYAPIHSPDGRFIVYLARISGSQKLFRLDLDTSKKTQLTFGTQDEAAAKFLDADSLIFSSTATDPATPLTPEVARNGNIFNLWSLSLKTGNLQQYTDALGGVLSPVVLSKDGGTPRLAFVDYYKGNYSLHTFDLKEPLHTAASSDFGSPGEIVDFQAPLQHTLVAENKKKKGRFEKMFLDGRPPVNVGVTSGGDVFGGSMVSFTDVLGDQQFSMYASSVQQYKTMSFSYLNLSRRFQYALQGYSQTQFFYGYGNYALYDPIYSSLISRDDALATETVRGGSIFGIYPFSTYRRVQLSGGLVDYNQEYADPGLQFEADRYQQENFGTTLFNSGLMMPLGVSFIQETTVFREYGPLSGSTMRLSYEGAPKLGNLLSRQTTDGDARYYMRLGANGVLALRAYGFKSWGDVPGYMFFGGNSEMRGYEYREFFGHKGFYTNAELRFPLINAMATPIGILGGIRGVFFANFGGAGINSQPFTIWTDKPVTIPPVFTLNGQIVRPAQRIEGFRLVDARASYGIGLETFALGFPIHFDWSYRTLFNEPWEDVVYADREEGGSSGLRKARFSIWIGYDF